MAKSKSKTESVIPQYALDAYAVHIKLNSEKRKHEMTWPYDAKRNAIERAINALTDKHIKLRELLKPILEKWKNVFNEEAVLSEGFNKFITKNLSDRAAYEKDNPDQRFPWESYPISRFYMSGYDKAIYGENPYLDEMIVIFSPEEMQAGRWMWEENNKPGVELLDTIKGYLEAIQNSYVLNFEKIKDAPLKAKKLTAPITALFCWLLDASKIRERGNLSVTEYCKTVCADYTLQYTDRVRQSYLNSNSSSNIKKVETLIVSAITDEGIRKKLTQYIDSKKPVKQKLYD